MNLNTLARTITLAEGKKINLTIGQVKEVLRLVLIELADAPIGELMDLFRRHKKR